MSSEFEDTFGFYLFLTSLSAMITVTVQASGENNDVKIKECSVFQHINAASLCRSAAML